MDIEDMFNEDSAMNQPLVIPQFDPCSGDGTNEELKEEKKKEECCNGKSLTCSSLSKDDLP